MNITGVPYCLSDALCQRELDRFRNYKPLVIAHKHLNDQMACSQTYPELQRGYKSREMCQSHGVQSWRQFARLRYKRSRRNWRGALCERELRLVGLWGVGKTTVGQSLAYRLKLPFDDLDAKIVSQYGTIKLQFERDGEGAFRTRETAALASVATGPMCVLSTGGGAWLAERNHELLRPCFHRVVPDGTLGCHSGTRAARARPSVVE